MYLQQSSAEALLALPAPARRQARRLSRLLKDGSAGPLASFFCPGCYPPVGAVFISKPGGALERLLVRLWDRRCTPEVARQRRFARGFARCLVALRDHCDMKLTPQSIGALLAVSRVRYLAHANHLRRWSGDLKAYVEHDLRDTADADAANTLFAQDSRPISDRLLTF